MEQPLIQILVVVVIILMGIKNAEVGKGFVGTAFGHE